jgi:sugar/nucleoside kinase (ribokinase family)
MLAAIGDLVEDIVVHLEGPVHLASDTAATIRRRRGGSAANVVETAARMGFATRFIGRVGDDGVGRQLVTEMAAAGVDTGPVRFGGSTGTIVVLVDTDGERTMLTDRRACLGLDRPDPTWLDAVEILHVPLYSLVGRPLADTTKALIDTAHERGIAVSLDVSSSAVIEALDHPGRLLEEVAPDVVLANVDEAAVLGLDGAVGSAVTVIKRGAEPAVVHVPGQAPVEVAAVRLAAVSDTTGAGDAFAAGFLARGVWRHDVERACRDGHRAAADVIVGHS